MKFEKLRIPRMIGGGYVVESEIARRIIEEQGLETYIFPCCSGHKDHDWFSGKTVYKTCSSVHKCEWILIVEQHIAYINKNESKKYKLVLCPDKEPNGQNDSEPDARLVNDDGPNEEFVIEVKSIHELDNQRNKDDKSFNEFAMYMSYYINQNITQLQQYPYGLLMDSDIRWGEAWESEKKKYSQSG
ncbi:hypothetical protein [Cohnella rhizosphaerae]|uniref:Uncharacterized protein n=1 Tax=Cohnella rhizosphaerae TaxID=1457232 RepID=A0A9X4QRF5_9BACL|nr:hypothetical protein [Cohnella rhizosphaerae]MDG0808525.1 hypothetical protein [Cohnella rhizosphaerae]